MTILLILTWSNSCAINDGVLEGGPGGLLVRTVFRHCGSRLFYDYLFSGFGFLPPSLILFFFLLFFVCFVPLFFVCFFVFAFSDVVSSFTSFRFVCLPFFFLFRHRSFPALIEFCGQLYGCTAALGRFEWPVNELVLFLMFMLLLMLMLFFQRYFFCFTLVGSALYCFNHNSNSNSKKKRWYF